MISTRNEWGRLRRIVVGDATRANWPINDAVYRQEAHNSLWTQTPAPVGAVPQWIIDETNEDLSQLCAVLTQHGVEVVRPSGRNFQQHDGLYNYCPRDRFLIYGDTVVDPAMMYPCRDQEYECYTDILEDAGLIIHMPRDDRNMVLDAAQTDLIWTLERQRFTVIPLTLRHSRTLGGGFHCVTLDLIRKNS